MDKIQTEKEFLKLLIKETKENGDYLDKKIDLPRYEHLLEGLNILQDITS